MMPSGNFLSIAVRRGKSGLPRISRQCCDSIYLKETTDRNSLNTLTRPARAASEGEKKKYELKEARTPPEKKYIPADKALRASSQQAQRKGSILGRRLVCSKRPVKRKTEEAIAKP